MAFFVVPNWFLCTDAENYYTSVILSLCWIPSSNFSSMRVCVRNVHHVFQLTDSLVAVALNIPLVMPTNLVAKIFRR